MLTGMAETARTHQAGEKPAQPMVWGLLSSVLQLVCTKRQGDGRK